jgi:hypothetical protein
MCRAEREDPCQQIRLAALNPEDSLKRYMARMVEEHECHSRIGQRRWLVGLALANGCGDWGAHIATVPWLAGARIVRSR